jgi:hypothetical protein
MLNIVIALALLATLSTLGLGVLTMVIGGSVAKDYSERFMWLRVGLQTATVALIIAALYITNT